jgi:hypothetical protein
MSEHIKAHYVSPMAKEDEISIEDMLSEIPEGNLDEVGIVQGRIFMPASFAQECVKHSPSTKTKLFLVE